MSLSAQHQLPAYSPLPAAALARAMVARIASPVEQIHTAVRVVAEAFRASEVTLVDSGRSALQLAIAIAVARQASRRVVALPAFQCFELASAAVGAECQVTFYDIDPCTLAPDLDSLEQTLREGVRVVVIAPLYGLPVDWDAISDLVRQYGAFAIEDAAQGHGAEWHGQPLGSLGSLSVVSFGRGKGWTGGSGGALCGHGEHDSQWPGENSLPPASARQELQVIAATSVQQLFGRPGVYGIPAAIPALQLGETLYRHPSTPTRVPTFSAALLVRTLEASTREASIRRSNALSWRQELPENVVASIAQPLAGSLPGYLRFPIRMRDASVAVRGDQAIRRSGMAPSYPTTLPRLPALSDRLVDGQRTYPGADSLARDLVTLPTHSRVTAWDRERILSLCKAWT